MKIKAANAGALTNFEVLDFLRSRGASKDPTRVIVPVAPSEFKVYDYLVETAACNQTREHINEFLEKCKKYSLAKAEVLNIINLRPSSLVEIDPIIEQSEKRFEEQLEELVNLVAEVLPAAQQTQPKPEEEIEEENEEMADGEKTEHEGHAVEAEQIHNDENEGS
ncbi:hypothetical protein SLA2020_342520 [Shorea laevis]